MTPAVFCFGNEVSCSSWNVHGPQRAGFQRTHEKIRSIAGNIPQGHILNPKRNLLNLPSRNAHHINWRGSPRGRKIIIEVDPGAIGAQDPPGATIAGDLVDSRHPQRRQRGMWVQKAAAPDRASTTLPVNTHLPTCFRLLTFVSTLLTLFDFTAASGSLEASSEASTLQINRYPIVGTVSM